MIGTTVSHYRIVAELGRGGMGIVYRAEDTRLNRQVALKFLPQHGLITAEQRSRFAQEAQTAATLNHPNICTIHSIEEGAEGQFIVMEFVEGQTLREKGQGKGLKLQDALEFAIQIAEALQDAHARGVVHRDIKSENIMITPARRAKVMDFGLAKLRGAMKLTRTSSTIGTLAYMSPEQIQGEDVDARADLFSFGVVLYEMLTGRMPFRGEHEAAMVYSIVNEEPEPLSTHLPDAPAGLEQLLAKALEKDPADRYQSAADLAVDLRRLRRETGRVSRIGKRPADGESRSDGVADVSAPPSTHTAARERAGGFRIPGSPVPMAALVVLGLAIGLGVSHLLFPAATEPVVMRFSQLTDLPGMEDSPAMSPDGSFIAFEKPGPGGKRDIFWQRTGGGNPLNLTEGSGADNWAPSFSPDGSRIAFRSDRGGGGIFLMGATGESVRRLTDFGHNPEWAPDGGRVVVATEGVVHPYARGTTSQLWVVDVESGQATMIFEGDAVQPSWSPGGQRIAFWGLPHGTGQRDLWTIAANGGVPVRMTDDIAVDWNPAWSADGRYLYFASDRGGTMNLWRIPIDEASGEVRGEPEPVTVPSAIVGHLAVSGDGRYLVYQSVASRMNIRRVRFDPDRETFAGTPLSVTEGSRFVLEPAVSPDGNWVVVRSGFSPEDLFLAAADGSDMRRLTNDIHKDRGPTWTPDGDRIVFYSDRGGRYELWWIRPDGSGLEQLTRTTGSVLWQPRVDPSGDRIFFMGDSGVQVTDLKPGTVERSIRSLPTYPEVGVIFTLTAVSSDGRWLAGHRRRPDDSPIPGVTVYSIEREEYAVAHSGGYESHWLPDGRRLLFRDEKGLALLDRESGRTRRLVIDGVSPDRLGTTALSADGRWLYFAEVNQESDIWQASLQ